MKMSPLILSFAAALLTGCGEKPDVDPAPVPPAPDGSVATVYTTSVAGKRLDESTIALKKPDDVHFYKVERSGETFQEVDGFGLAVTQASCYNLLLMPAEERTAFLTELFSREEGLGSSLIRVCIGGSDFSLQDQSGGEDCRLALELPQVDENRRKERRPL